MKEILIPLNFTTTPTVYDTKQSFSTSDEASGVLTFTTTADVAGTVASLTIRNASENANRQTVRIERLDVNSSPFSYTFKNPLPFGQYEGTILLKKNVTVIASAIFLFGVNSSLSAEVLPDLVKVYSLHELVENVETEVSNLKDAFNLTVSETVKGVNKTESSLQAQENVRYLNEHQRIANENARIAAELERKDTFDTLVDSEVIEQTVVQEVANEFQQIEATYANRLLSTEQQLADVETAYQTAAANLTLDSEVILARNSSAKNKSYVSLGTRIEETEGDINANATNFVQNGDFSSGTNDWLAGASALSASNNTLFVTGNGVDYNPKARQVLADLTGKKVYLRARARVRGSGCTIMFLRTNDVAVSANVSNPVVDQWYDLIAYARIAASSEISINHRYADAVSANGKIMEVQFVTAIEVTTVFGTGKEPTLEQLNYLISRFSNGWFDGTRNLYQSKQEIAKRLELEGSIAAVDGRITSEMAKNINGLTSISATNQTYSDANNVPNNRVVRYTIAGCPNVPSNGLGTLLTYAYSADTGIGGRVQIFVDNTGKVFSRMYWSNVWGAWFPASEEQLFKQLGTVTTVESPYYDANLVLTNRVVRYGGVGLNIPTTAGTLGTLFCYVPDSGQINGTSQTFISRDGDYYFRYYWNKWFTWKKISTEEQLFKQLGTVTTVESPYYDANLVLTNRVVRYGGVGLNIPTTAGTLFCYVPDSGQINGTSQTFISRDGDYYFRYYWNTWFTWKKISTTDMASALDYRDYYASFSMFESVGVIGDSYASGAFGETSEALTAKDHYNKSWPQMLGRKNGVSVTNYTKGGMSTRSWLVDANYGLPKLLTDTPSDIYILALIRNDYTIENRGETGYKGTIADITGYANFADYPDSFYGNYGKIIEQIKIHSPNAKLILMTGDYTSSNTLGTAYNAAVVEIASHYGLPTMIQLEESYFSSSFYRSGWPAGGHPGAMQYSGMELAIERMFQKAVLNNKAYFTY